MKGRFNLTNLKKHYEFINGGKLTHKNFDFGVFTSQDGCGTCGCSFGEVPTWNEDVEFIKSDRPYVSFSYKKEGMKPEEIASKIFGINRDEYLHLFIPNHQKNILYGGCSLGCQSTKEEVNENLRIFIEKIEKGEIV